MTHHWKASDLQITDLVYRDDPASSCEFLPPRTLYLKHLEIIKVSGKPTYDTYLENS